MAHIGDRQGRSRSSAALPSIQMAGLEFGRLDFGDNTLKPLSKPTQPLSLKANPRKRKRAEDEDPTNSFEIPAKRRREDRSGSTAAFTWMAGLQFGRLDFGDDIQKPLSKPTQPLSLKANPRKRKRSEDEDSTNSFEIPAKRRRRDRSGSTAAFTWMAGLQFGRLDFGDDIQKPLSKPTQPLNLKANPRKRKRSEDEDSTNSFERPAKRRRRDRSSVDFSWMACQEFGSLGSGFQIQKPPSKPTQSQRETVSGSIAPLLSESTQRKRTQPSSEDEDPTTSFESPAKRSWEEEYIKGPLLGQGGFGSVYAGTRSSDGFPVAIKYVFKDEEHEEIEVDGQGLLPLEVALMIMVNSAPACPNVLQLLDWFDYPGHYIMILERPDPCQDLQRFCEENDGCLDESQTKKVLVQLINALKHCESRGVFHRDVKPQNLLISTDSHELKLLDFGCGHLLKDSEYKSFAGTLSYTPPEWFRSHKYRAGPATVWSLGVTLYSLLCGSVPFKSARRVRRLHLPNHLSADCRNLIRWCLRTAADDRPSLQDIEQHPWLQCTG